MEKIYQIELFIILLLIFLAIGIYGSLHYLNLLETAKQQEILALGCVIFTSIMIAFILFYLSKFMLRVRLTKKEKK